jgi:hypothetical protein
MKYLEKILKKSSLVEYVFKETLEILSNTFWNSYLSPFKFRITWQIFFSLGFTGPE